MSVGGERQNPLDEVLGINGADWSQRVSSILYRHDARAAIAGPRTPPFPPPRKQDHHEYILPQQG